MQKVDISLSIENEKKDALDFFLKKENTSVKAQMDKALVELYERAVPEAVREYLDGKSAAAPKAKRAVRSAKSKPIQNEIIEVEDVADPPHEE